MGVDSGLPDFRGPAGFWRAYPPYAELSLHFIDLADPRWFRDDPALAWGFYGHRLNLYRGASPHEGFCDLLAWSQRMRHGAFVFTSNVDGHFQRAGFPSERVLEVHGSIHFVQCTRSCTAGTVAADALQICVDKRTMRAREPLPACPGCGALARPNILMFNDWDWDRTRTTEQYGNLQAWLQQLEDARLTVIECGAGTAVPTVRLFCEELAKRHGASMIRINSRESSVPGGQIGVPLGAREALAGIAQRLNIPSR
jgi:NAD-dependent SIR2 family protein deacetylase